MKVGSTPLQSWFKIHVLVHSGHPLSAENIFQRNWSLHHKDPLAKWHLGLYLKKEDLLTNRERAAWKKALRLDGGLERQKGVHWSSRWAESGAVNWNWTLQGLKGHTEDSFGLCVLRQPCLTLCDPVDCSPPGSSVQGDSPGKNTGVGCLVLLQGIFPTPGSNPGLLHCRWILYHLSHLESPFGLYLYKNEDASKGGR